MSNTHSSEQPVGISTVIPGALVDHLDGTQLVTGADDKDPASRATRIALEQGTPGRGRSRVVFASFDVINAVAEYAEVLLFSEDSTRDEKRAAQGWVNRVPKMHKEVRHAHHAGGVPVVHHFTNTTRAYDATQSWDIIEDGDVLVIEREQVVGFLNQAWPVAVTEQHGTFHTLKVPAREIEDGKYAVSIDGAERVAAELGVALALAPEPIVEAEELAATVEAVEEAEESMGTWRGAWIGTDPSQQLTLDGTDPDAQQGALFS